MLMSDPNAVEEALDEAIDAFNMAGHGRPVPESDINTDDDWKTQLTKGCRLLAAVEGIVTEGYYTATVELSFGIIERSLEAFAMEEGGDELYDFQTDSHVRCYDRAARFGLFSEMLTEDLKKLYADNRTDSYYGDRRPTDQQAQVMYRLARTVHQYTVDQIQEGGVCNCNYDE